MTGYDYIGAENRSKVRFKRVLSALLVLSLLAAVITGVFIWQREKSRSDTIESYMHAIEEQDYEEAIDIYRSLREKALADDPSLSGNNSTTEMLHEIEADIESMLEQLFTQIRNNEKPEQKQLEYAEGMAEIAGVRIIEFINEQVVSYLHGDINLAQIRQRISGLLALANVQPVMSELSDQLDIMAKAVPLVIDAQEKLNNRQWYQAHQAWLEITKRDDIGDFAVEYAFSQLDYTEEQMYAPLLDDADRAMQGGRYVTAGSRLEAMLEIFPQDETIKNKLDECSEFIPDETVKWTEYDLVEILSLRPLIIEPETAFDNDDYSAAANDAMITVSEFSSILEQLYANDYVLVDADKLYTEEGTYREFTVPAGKKPLIIVLDSLNYYVTRRESGNAWNLVIDDNGQVSASYLDSNGKTRVEREAEAVGILDMFVEEHPDFSYDGAKGVISFTGYECLFGYVISSEQGEVRNAALAAHGYETEDWSEKRLREEREEAQEIIDKLHDTGWIFASSTWGNMNVRDNSLEDVKKDIQLWQDHIAAITGPVDIMNYPYGAYVSGNDEKLIYLREQGFLFMTGLGNTPYRIFGSNGLYADKVQVSGYGLRQPEQSGLGRLIDTTDIYETEARP